MTEPTPPSSEPRESGWERKLLERLAFEQLREQRRTRRWGIFFKLFFVAYLVLLLFMFNTGEVGKITGRHTALVEINGVIGAGQDVDADQVISGLRAAFKAKNVAGIILRINSPGGSPVQAGYINDEIRRLREKNPKRPVYAVISDICASGGYYIAAGADAIYADKASIVGSIGVLMDAFGFVGSMKKLGVERRLLTAGERKGFMDPFSPVNPEDREHAQRLLDQIHKQFITVVEQGRGEKLVHDQDLFSGLFWTGEEAVKLGLVDKLGSAGYVAREVIGAEDVVDYTPQPDLFERVSREFGIAMARLLGTDMLRQGLGTKLALPSAQ
jgi:protease-4